MFRYHLKTYKIFVFILLPFLGTSCLNDKTQRGARKKQPDGVDTRFVDTLSYEMAHFSLKSQRTVAQEESTDTTYFDVSYPKFEQVALNDYVQKILTNANWAENGFETVEQEGNAFIQGFEDDVENNPYPRPWFSQKDVRVLHNTPLYIALDYSFAQYLGGAHGLYGTFFKNYLPQVQDTIGLADIITENNLVLFTQLAESIFRSQENVGADHSLEEDYFFEEGKFALTDNFVLNDKGILFLYNIYEIKPYASGVTELQVPYSDFSDMLTTLGQQVKLELLKKHNKED